MSEQLKRMIEALGFEIAAIKKKGAGSHVELRGGERVGESGGSWLYRFVVTEDIYLRDETPIRVTCGQQDVSGFLVSFANGVLVVALEKDLGPKIATARLVANDSFLIERLKERLEKIASGEASHNRAAAERVIGLSPIGSADKEPNNLVLQDGSLNSDQCQAVRRSLGSDTTFVWGPPGTGKTTTLARIVEAHYRAGRSILIVSNTNIAVDTALMKVAERLKKESGFNDGLVLRLGPIVEDNLKNRFGAQVGLEQVVARRSENLLKDKEALTSEASKNEADQKSLSTALAELDRLLGHQSKLASLEQEKSAIQTRITAKEQEVEDLKRKGAQFLADLERARSMGPIRRFFLGLSPESLEKSAAETELARQEALRLSRSLVSLVWKFESEIKGVCVALDRLLEATRTYPERPTVETRLRSCRARANTIRARLAEIEQELSSVEQQVLAGCKVLATTVYRTYLGKNLLRSFDVVVIDEASMLMPPLVYYTAGLASQSVTVAGDFRQLSPIVLSEEPIAEEWLKRDVFEKAGITKQVDRHESPAHLMTLRTQYRMRDPICSVINDLFYDGRLSSHPSANDVPADFPFGKAPLLYVDTAPFHPWVGVPTGTYSRFNLLHALLVRKIVCHLDKSGYLPSGGALTNDAIGVIAPYSAQARLIQALLQDRIVTGSPAPLAGVAASVFRFQGNEKKTMVFDLTDSFGWPLSKFLKAKNREEDGGRLLNVGASRAKHHLILIANFTYLRSKAPHGGVVLKILDEFTKRGVALDVRHLLPLGDSEWINGLDRVIPPDFPLPENAAGVFTEGTFYPAFLTDLKRVQKSVVLFSPYATAKGTSRWYAAFRAALSRGVRIRILTLPPEAPGGGGTDEVAEVVRELRALGVTVDLRAKMHEKIAILDGRILWHGSLNILSQRNTHESMLRIVSPQACQHVERFVTTTGTPADRSTPLDEQQHPDCPIHGIPMIWKKGRYGVWFVCEVAGCPEKVNPSKFAKKKVGSGVGSKSSVRNSQGSLFDKGEPDTRCRGSDCKRCKASRCKGRLLEKHGRFGPFLGCSCYPGCRHTENIE